jgi:hypothetical protein
LGQDEIKAVIRCPGLRVNHKSKLIERCPGIIHVMHILEPTWAAELVKILNRIITNDQMVLTCEKTTLSISLIDSRVNFLR